MHRDMKVGLALGVLLVGVVGALFFRREPEKKPVPPSLQNGNQIDRQIAERARGPYLTQPEEFVDSNTNTTSTRGSADKRTGTTITAAKPPVTALTLDEENRPANVPAGDSEKTIASTKAGSPPAPLPGNNDRWEGVGTPETVARKDDARETPARTVATTESAGPQRTHVVEPGETLSGLAAKYLGSTARYREIYEANRDVLRSPDSLTAGLTLKIPADAQRGKPGRRTGPSIAGSGSATTRSVSQSKRERIPAVPAASVNDSAKETPAVDSPAAPTTPTFTPVRRSPFAAGRIPNRTATPAAPAADASKDE